jgi:hypothetical protein
MKRTDITFLVVFMSEFDRLLCWSQLTCLVGRNVHTVLHSSAQFCTVLCTVSAHFSRLMSEPLFLFLENHCAKMCSTFLHSVCTFFKIHLFNTLNWAHNFRNKNNQTKNKTQSSQFKLYINSRITILILLQIICGKSCIYWLWCIR